VTHQLGEARVLAREALLLEQGRVCAAGLAAEVLGAAARGLLAAEGEGEENILEGTLERPDGGGLRLRVRDGLALWVPEAPELAVGTRAAYAVPAADILLAVQPLTGVSARNVMMGTVLDVEPRQEGEDVATVEVAGVRWVVWLTSASVRELGVVPGAAVSLAVKTSACRRLR